ncbi:MAG: hypothetical protein ABI910_13630 [Gemmatimonadota bacterium]
MDVLVMLEDRPEHSTVLAHVNSVPSPLNSERPSRDVVTLFGDATPESLALALAAAVEAHREPGERSATIRHVALWPERGAVGDAAWRDDITGHLVTNDLAIPFATLQKTAERLLVESGAAIRRLVAGLLMPDWPEGTHRAISFSIAPLSMLPAGAGARIDALLDSYRQADGIEYDNDGD